MSKKNHIPQKIKLGTLIDEFSTQSEMINSYLDKETGEIYFISEDDRFALEHEEFEPPEWQKKHLEQNKAAAGRSRPQTIHLLAIGI